MHRTLVPKREGVKAFALHPKGYSVSLLWFTAIP